MWGINREIGNTDQFFAKLWRQEQKSIEEILNFGTYICSLASTRNFSKIKMPPFTAETVFQGD